MIGKLSDRINQWILKLRFLFRPMPIFLEELERVASAREEIKRALEDIEKLSSQGSEVDTSVREKRNVARQNLEDLLPQLDALEAGTRERIATNDQFWNTINEEQSKFLLIFI